MLTPLGLLAQLMVKPIPKHLPQSEASNGRSARILVEAETIQLPFWDDFSYDGPDPDTTFWQHGEDVLVNSTLGLRPPTINVATFDGINSAGQPHDILSEIVGPTDSLISQPIDLSLVAPEKRNSVYLSFFWQMQGLGERPDQDDSIRLELLNSDTVWVRKWVETGIEENVTDAFQKVYIQITEEEKFFHKGFQMKFQTFGKTTGPFDAWHIDYVYLNQDRVDEDESIGDRSIATQPLSIFSTYTSIPYSQLFAFPDTIFAPLSFEVATQSTLEAQAVQVIYTATDVLANLEILRDSINALPLNLPSDQKKRDTITSVLNLNHSDLNTDTDSLEIEIELRYRTADGFLIQSIDGNDTTFLNDASYNYSINNAIRRTYHINDVLSYDDGIAEFSAGLNQKNGQLVMQYVLAAEDSITHLDIYFPQIKPAVSGEIIELLVLKDLNGDLGSILAKQPTTVMYSDSINKFVRYQFEKPVVVSDTFYIGFEQNTRDFVGVGLDKNNDQSSRIFFKTQDIWEQNVKVKGTLMIRPIFGDTEVKVTTSILEGEKNNITFYPNPAHNTVFVRGTFDHVELFTISGLSAQINVIDNTFSTAHLSNGIYILRTHTGNSTQSHKLIIHH